MLKRFWATKKLSSKNRFPKWRFLYDGIDITYSYPDPQKALPCPERRPLTYFL